MVLLCGSTAAFGLYLLTRCAAMAPHRAASFSSLSNLTYPGLARLYVYRPQSWSVRPPTTDVVFPTDSTLRSPSSALVSPSRTSSSSER